jgi:hypothetical protein
MVQNERERERPDKKHFSIFRTYVEAAALGEGDNVSIPFCNKQYGEIITLSDFPHHFVSCIPNG